MKASADRGAKGTGGHGRVRIGHCVLAPLVLVGLPLMALAQGIVVVPTFSLSETYTNNRDLKANDPQSDLITQVSPGLSVSARRGELQGNLTYALNGLLYARESSLNTVYHTLASTARLDLLDGRAGLNASASASRQTVSAFGTQGSDPVSNNGNQTQVFSYSLAPFFTGRLLGDVAYRASAGYAASRTGSSTVGDTATLNASVGLSGRRGPIGWGLDASRDISETGDRPRSHNGRVGGSISYAPDVELQLSMRAGTEVDDLLTGRSERTTTWGAGLSWVPGPRTSLSLDYDRRFFGRSYAATFSHRMARTIWTAGDSRSLQTGGATGRGVASTYELFYAQFASIEPDPVRREALVRSFLAANGLDPNTQVIVSGFLSSQPTVTRNQNLSVAYQGLRATLAVSYVRTRSTSLVTGGLGGDDLSSGGVVRQQGWNLSLSHRLTPEASLVVSASQQRTGSTGTQAGNSLRTLVATWSARLGPHANVSVGGRYAVSDGDVNGYHESALIGTLRVQF